jgi:predicted CXXCH cytochrome family protein
VAQTPSHTSTVRLDYIRRPHWLRRFRLIVFILAVIGSISLVFGYSRLVGPSARTKWNEEMKKSINNSIARGEKIRPPWNPEELFNTGPISENHSRLAAGCQACHWGSNPDVARLIGVGKASDASLANDQSTFGKLSVAWKSEGTKGMVGAYQKLTKLEQMDLACITCHVDYQQLPVHLHLPQAAQLHLAQASFPFAVVGSGACSNCHKEHEGHSGERPRRMADVSSETCAGCHNQPGTTVGTSEIIDILKDPRRGRVAYPIGTTPVHTSMTMNLGEGLRRFLVWRAPGQTTGFDANWSKPFHYYGPENPRDKEGPGFAGHPPFRYELPGARDPGKILYGHMQHEQPKVMAFVKANTAEILRIRKEASEVNGVAIQEWINTDGSQNCMFCHEPGPDREYRQQVKYDVNCKACHQMNIVFPPITSSVGTFNFETRVEVPHRDPEKVRAFLDPPSVMVELDRSAFRVGITDPQTRRSYVEAALTNLKNRGISTQMDLLKRIFYSDAETRNSPTTNRVHTDCVFCHKEMLQPPSVEQYTDVAHAPVMLPIALTDRWVNHGPFTHEPHKHMKCGDCHASEEVVKDWRTNQPLTTGEYQQDASGAKQPVAMTYSVGNAHKSRRTADILMPRQRLCAECHRPMPPEAAAKLAAQGGPTSKAWENKAQTPQERMDFQRASGGVKYECLDCHKFHAPSEAIPFKEQLLKPDAPLPKMAEATVR